MIFPYSRMGRMRVLKSLLNDLQLICKNERLIKPVIRFPLFIQSFMCFLNFSSVLKVMPRSLTVSLIHC